MAIKYFDQSLIRNKVNIVNFDKEAFKLMGIKPQELKINLMYLNNSGNPVLVGSDHCGADIIRDVIRALEIMQKDYNYVVCSIGAKSVLDEAKCWLERNKELFKKSDDILDFNVGEYINRRANIFMDPLYYSRYIKGVYNDWAMMIINSLKESKYEIYNFIYSLILKSGDLKECLSNLFETFVIVKKSDFDNGNYKNLRYLANDILIQLIGFDKIETQLSKTITTSKINVCEEFFNYMIMGYDVVQIPKVVFNAENNSFNIIRTNEFTGYSMEREYEEEIKLIKKLVPYSEREKYFID